MPDPKMLGGKFIICGRCLAVEHVLDMSADGTTKESLLEAYSWLESEDIDACPIFN